MQKSDLPTCPDAAPLPDRLTLDEYTMIHNIFQRVQIERLNMDYAEDGFWERGEAMYHLKRALDTHADVVYPDLYAKRKAEGVDVSTWKQP